MEDILQKAIMSVVPTPPHTFYLVINPLASLAGITPHNYIYPPAKLGFEMFSEYTSTLLYRRTPQR
jgi:hypothetical protein